MYDIKYNNPNNLIPIHIFNDSIYLHCIFDLILLGIVKHRQVNVGRVHFYFMLQTTKICNKHPAVQIQHTPIGTFNLNYKTFHRTEVSSDRTYIPPQTPHIHIHSYMYRLPIESANCFSHLHLIFSSEKYLNNIGTAAYTDRQTYIKHNEAKKKRISF